MSYISLVNASSWAVVAFEESDTLTESDFWPFIRLITYYNSEIAY